MCDKRRRKNESVVIRISYRRQQPARRCRHQKLGGQPKLVIYHRLTLARPYARIGILLKR